MPSDQDQQEPYLEQAPLEGGGHFSVGRQLREVRETYDLELEEVASALRIRPFYLQAIEETRYESLPGATYAIGFVRAYAEYLRLDPKELVERFKAEVSGLETRRSLQFPVPAQEGRVPGVALLLVAVLLAAVGYGVWYYVGQEGATFTDVVEPLPEDLASLVDPEEPQPEAAPSEPEPAQPPAVTDAPEPPSDELSTAEQTPADETAAGEAAAGEAPVEELLVQPLPEGLPAPDAPIDPDSSIGAGALSEAAPSEPAPAVEQQGEPQAAPEPETLPNPVEEPLLADESEAAVEAPAPDAVADPAPGRASDPAADLLAQDQTGAPQAAPETASETAPGAEPAPEPEPAPDAAVEETLPAPPPPERSEAGEALPEGRVYGAVNESARVVLLAESDAWVEVRDQVGRLILSRVLRRGDSYRVPARADLVMMTGNAGGLAVTLDGQRLPSLGEQGQVRRDIPLSPEAIRAELGQ